MITLVPKMDNPKGLQDFRPISLCNVQYKIISKILASRLRPIMAKIISEAQGAFIQGHRSSDNIIIAKEFFHQMR